MTKGINENEGVSEKVTASERTISLFQWPLQPNPSVLPAAMLAEILVHVSPPRQGSHASFRHRLHPRSMRYC